MITGKLYGGLDIIGEAILLKELADNEVLVMVLALPPPMEDMPFGKPHGCQTIVWKAKLDTAPKADELTYIEN